MVSQSGNCKSVWIGQEGRFETLTSEGDSLLWFAFQYHLVEGAKTGRTDGEGAV